MPLNAVHTSVSALIHAPAERVAGIYADYAAWPRVFGATIKGVRLLDEKGATKTLEIDHVEGRVINVMSVVAPDEIVLQEWKRRFDARFTNHFEPVAEGTRYSIDAEVTLKGPLEVLAFIAKPFVRARLRRFVLDPVKRIAEAGPRTA